MFKLKITRVVFTAVLVTVCMFSSISCASAPVQDRVVINTAAVIATPNVVKPGASTEFYGSNFKPGEEVAVYIITFPGTSQLLGMGLATKKPLLCNELGSFAITDLAPSLPGIYPVIVKDKKGGNLASTVLVVKK